MEKFSSLSKIGQGSFGCVYKAFNNVSGKFVCLKEIQCNFLTLQERRAALQEAALLASVSCEYIVRYFDSFIENDNLYLEMELCEGGDLYHFIQSHKEAKKGLLSEDLVCKWLIQSCLALYHLHSLFILHRDFKTMNIFLDKNLNVRVGDVGMAKILNSSQSAANSLVGTPYYLSPEQLEGKAYAQLSDIWSLGCCLYELLTLSHPFHADNQYGLILKIIKGKYAPVSKKFSAELRQLLGLLLSRDKKKRPTAKNILLSPFLMRKAQELKICFTQDFLKCVQEKQEVLMHPKRHAPIRFSAKKVDLRKNSQNHPDPLKEQTILIPRKQCRGKKPLGGKITHFRKLDVNLDLIHDHNATLVANLPRFSMDGQSFDSLSSVDCGDDAASQDVAYNYLNAIDSSAPAFQLELNQSENLVESIDASQDFDEYEASEKFGFEPVVPIWNIKDGTSSEIPILVPEVFVELDEDRTRLSESDIVSEADDTQEANFLKKNRKDALEAQITALVGSQLLSNWIEQLEKFNSLDITECDETFSLHPQPPPDILHLLFKLVYSNE